MNVYSELLELLTPERKDAPAGLFGTLTAVSPLTVTVRGTALTEGLFYLQGPVFCEEAIGRELPRLPRAEALGTPGPEETLPLFREWAVDWENRCFALRRGEPYLVSGDEALKIWVTRALRPESQRFRYTAWSADYGNELTLLLGGCVDQGILESQVRQYVRDALLACPYIREVDGFSFSKKGSRVEARFTVHTVYEEFTQKTEVSIR